MKTQNTAVTVIYTLGGFIMVSWAAFHFGGVYASLLATGAMAFLHGLTILHAALRD